MNRCRIAIVEDEAIVAMDIEDRLTAMGYEFAGRAASGKKALELVQKVRPDVVLMDIRLQGAMDGIAAAEQILKLFHLPVIFLTAYSEETTLERAKLAQPYGYILKPFDDRELKSTIEIAIYKHRAEEEIRRLNLLYDVLSQVNQAVVRINTREELLSTVCRLVVERGAIDLAWIGWLNGNGSRVSPVASFATESPIPDHENSFIDEQSDSQGISGEAIRKGEPFVCNQCSPQVCLYPATNQPASFGFQSCGSFPLRLRGKICGVLNLCSVESGFFREREIELLDEVAMDISFALDKIESDIRREQAEAQIRRQNIVLKGINRIFREALSSQTEEELGQTCLAVAKEVTGSVAGFFGELNAEGGLDRIAVNDSGRKTCSEAGLDRSQKPSTDSEIHEICARVLKEGKGFFSNPQSPSSSRSGFSQEHSSSTKAFLAAPLIRDGRTVGIIGLDKCEGDYTQQDLDALEAVTPAMVEAFSRKRAERSLRGSEAQRRTLLETIPDLVWLKDARGIYITCNTAFERFFGAKETDIAGKTDYDFVDKDLAEFFREHDRKAMTAGGPSINEEWLTFADGGYRGLFETIKTPMHDAAGEFIGVLGISRDITERKRTEAALRESEERLRLFFEHAPASLAMLDREMRYLTVSQRWLSDFHLEGRNLIGMSHYEVFPELSERWKRIHQRALTGEVLRGDMDRFVRADGSVQWLRWEVRPWRNDAGDIAGIAILSEDVTEHKQLEEERSRIEVRLRQAQKMEALGTLAGGIAHDFNNILGIIIGYTELALSDLDDRSQVMPELQQVLKAANRAKELVHQILAFSRLSEQEKKPLQVGLIVKEVMKMLRASLPSTVEIKMNVASKTVMLGDPTQIHQVLMNLCTNAAHAMREHGGVLEVSLTDVHLEPQAIPPHSGLTPGPHLQLVVKDTGNGIDPAIVDRIFDPFFTTKEQGVGTGLGLSVVHGIVKSHGGQIEVESIPHGGTTFQVVLPAMERPLVAENNNAAPLPRGRERILVVDDEPALAIATKHMLQRLGYEVVYQTNGIEALESFRQQRKEKPFDLVLTDMTMPHLTGIELAAKLLRLQQDLPILLCTGFSEKIDAEETRQLGICGVLMKPVTARELAGLIREALDARLR